MLFPERKLIMKMLPAYYTLYLTVASRGETGNVVVYDVIWCIFLTTCNCAKADPIMY